MPRTQADDAMIDRVLEREGGYVNHALDRGGPTNKGVTLRTLSDYLGHPATLREIQNITVETARNIYYGMYIERPGFSRIEDLQLRELLFDAGVNHGPVNAIKMLQRAVNTKDCPVTVDGIFGKQTLNAIEGLAPDQRAMLRTRLLAQRLRFYANLMAAKPSQTVFAAGWFNRVADLIEEVG